jgi:hypothetical protein
MSSRRSVLYINDTEYKLGWIGDYYMRLCLGGAAIGASIGFLVAAVTPIVIVGAGVVVLGKNVCNTLKGLK